MSIRACSALLAWLIVSCAGDAPKVSVPVDSTAAPDTELAAFGAGCFWCSEAAFEQIDGVVDVRSGFMGGEAVANPEDPHALIAAGHAEVVRVVFDPSRTSYADVLEWFWLVHDPTSLNRQGEDEGPEYRSAIFTYSDAQRETAESSRAKTARRFDKPIVTEIVAAGTFYPAPEEHQDYYQKNRDSQYCRTTIAPHLLRVGLDD